MEHDLSAVSHSRLRVQRTHTWRHMPACARRGDSRVEQSSKGFGHAHRYFQDNRSHGHSGDHPRQHLLLCSLDLVGEQLGEGEYHRLGKLNAE